jgi:pyruvate dehydrogenase phosphatase
VKKAFAGDLGPFWTEDTADWPIDYISYTSESAFCEALKAKATTDIVTIPNGIVAHTLTLQPFTKPASNGNEDRHTVQYWDLPSGQWTFVGVFDGVCDSSAPARYLDLTSPCDAGHSGHETSEYTVKLLPTVIRSHLESTLGHDLEATPGAIGDAVSNAIRAFDKSLEDDLKADIPDNFESLGDEELQAVINDQVTGGHVYTRVIRCMRGACSVIIVIDPSKENLWSVNLGDCEAG